MDNATQINLQRKVVDFALAELVSHQRESFQPIWSVDSWVKFLIWLALNCGLSGDRESLEEFAAALGSRLTCRMRRLFFERVLDDLGLKVMGDPADAEVLVLPLGTSGSVSYEQAMAALESVGLSRRVVCDRDSWQFLDALIAIPWARSAQSC